MSTKAKEPSEGEVIVARALSSYAQLRANIASWSGLPAAGNGEEAGQDDKEEDFFTAESETAGVGYVVTQDEERSKTSTDKLRKQILGKRARGGTGGLERVGGSKRVSMPRKEASRTAKDDEESEEDEGRSGVGKWRMPAGFFSRTSTEDIVHAKKSNGTISPTAEGNAARKPPGSYLDEVLAERSRKRKKKKKAKDPA